MSARAHRRRHAAHEEEEHDNEERWLVSYADMMTLLFCLFMVLFAISSVNTSKFQALSKALQNAFSGRILSGGKAVMQTGSQTPAGATAPQPPLPALSPITSINDQTSSGRTAGEKASDREQEEFVELKRRIDALSRQQHVSSHVHTAIRPDGLVVELLTDGVFFDSGSAELKPQAVALLHKVGAIIAAEQRHPVRVEGFTDSQPIHTGVYPSNWQLSGARAAAVIQNFAADGVLSRRMSLAGYGAERPSDTNSTAAGRAKNRRVDVVLTRLHGNPTTSSSP